MHSRSLTSVDELDISSSTMFSPGVSSWDPHSAMTSATAFNTSLHMIDWRDTRISMTIPNAHKATIR
jgi:hypothetical protein